jgi:hypothetical protein
VELADVVVTGLLMAAKGIFRENIIVTNMLDPRQTSVVRKPISRSCVTFFRYFPILKSWVLLIVVLVRDADFTCDIA